MSLQREPLFLERQSYRRRRLHDGARLLPVLGGALFLLPVLWIAGENVPSTLAAFAYLFIVWSLLIFVAALLAPRLRADQDDRSRSDP